ncbi:MAG: CD1375 family protein [Anaerocolumna aminovalerica]|uniref:CD1375 family protein n=1 Tax=Anaerocolumna aminovalerica TaxID=1527 RepID=UPI00290C170A|nr:CD1375 family protein [Anaerocolumna aminovalerica]MDU6263699.1 CD1375 family protein [Anaerocolumna aminovalerica]
MIRQLLIFIFRKEVEAMAMIYVSLIIKGVKTFDQVPSTLSEQVRQILIDIDCEYLITE